MPTDNPTSLKHRAKIGHEMPIELTQLEVDRFWLFVEEAPSGCWEWTGKGVYDGYGYYSAHGLSLRSHRVSWTLLRGPIPRGMTLDHLCRNRLCVNPDHLEVVTSAVNVLRGIGPVQENAVKTHCLRGHEFSPINTRYYHDGRYRNCRICHRMMRRLRRQRRKQLLAQEQSA